MPVETLDRVLSLRKRIERANKQLSRVVANGNGNGKTMSPLTRKRIGAAARAAWARRKSQKQAKA